jgi:hypothetical protein
MLEHRVLLLCSRTTSPTGEMPVPTVQLILDGESGAALGYACWEPETTCSWRRLFGRGVLAVHEQEDEPLLFTVRRAWSLLPRREVRDAEGQPVGTLLARLVHDRHGHPVAALKDGLFRDRSQRVLAELTPSAEGLRLTFSDDIADEPFVKMLLLAAALQMAG